ncbi:unnamed protein product [Toxocara canis]|uniref:DUF1738 domain-containing protein n=1 Tax=Toxocara canis TaxID=6265 RepID=A0A183VBH1_TOXCA|nr:unnamed protein product [Toxocara canis]
MAVNVLLRQVSAGTTSSQDNEWWGPQQTSYSLQYDRQMVKMISENVASYAGSDRLNQFNCRALPLATVMRAASPAFESTLACLHQFALIESEAAHPVEVFSYRKKFEAPITEAEAVINEPKATSHICWMVIIASAKTGGLLPTSLNHQGRS